MFSVLFEVQPHREQWDSYLANSKTLHPELEGAQGLVENIRYRSLTRDGWILSLSSWRDEPSVVDWQAGMSNQQGDDRSQKRSLADYRLRVGEVTSDTWVADGQSVEESETAENSYVTLINAKKAPEWVAENNPQEIALDLGFDLNSFGDCISWDVFDAVFTPGEIILVVTWKDAKSANDHASTQIVPDDARVRVVRVVRDYAMFGHGEAPQLRPDAAGREAIRA